MDDFRRNVDPSTRRKTNKDLNELASLRQEYERTKSILETAEKKLDNEKEHLDQLSVNLEYAYNALSEVQVEIDADYLPEGAQPRNRIQTRDSLLLLVQQEEAAMDIQRRLVQASTEQQIAAERAFFIADRNISHFAEHIENVLESKKLIGKLDADKQARLKRMEKQVVARKDRLKKQEQEAREAQAAALALYQQQQAEIADKANKETRAKLAKENAHTRTLTATVKELNDTKQQDRVEAVLELKANVNAVRAEVATLAAKHVAKVERAKKQLEDEKESLLAQGLNPYVEFRRKELDEEASARERRMKAAVEQNKANLAAQMEKEHKLLEKQEKAKREAAKYEKEHRDSLGRHVIEERNRAYIEKKTSAHTEVLDPSGKAARVDPSQITDIADYSFGLGHTSRIPKDKMKSITHLIRQELAVDEENYGEYNRLVSGLQKATGSNGGYDESDEKEDDDSDAGGVGSGKDNKDMTLTTSDTSITQQHQQELDRYELQKLEQLGNNIGSVPCIDLAATAVNLANDRALKSTLIMKTTEEEGKESNDINNRRIAALSSAKYPTVTLSKFERSSLDRAKERHQDRIEYGTQQTAGGKIFQGDAFASTPAIVLFKDFEVGKVYKKHFTLTNVSYTFNAFKMLDLCDEIVDFFTINFTKPGRMSAGMSCSVEIIFKPQVNHDIIDAIHLLTETGPVIIPLQCLIKRCAPRVIDTNLDFDRMIIGQKMSLPVKIVNSQALPTRFSIEMVVSSPPVAPASTRVSPRPDATGATEENENGIEATTGTIVKSPRAVAADLPPDVDSGNDYIGREPATQDSELWSRVRRIMTAVTRQKRREQATPFVCYSASTKSTTDNDDSSSNSKETLITDGLLEGYSSTTITVRCAPLQTGEIIEEFIIRFDSVDESHASIDEQGVLVTKEQKIMVRVIVDELPLFVQDEIVDLRCTLYDRLYRRKLELYNRGNIAYRVTIKVYPMFQQFVEVSPTVFFVQAQASQSMNIKFAPTTAILHRLQHFFCPHENYQDAGLFALPIEIQVVNQDLPVYFTLQSITCPSTIVISTPTLDFGSVYIGQKSVQPLTLKNISMLPQKIAFVRVKKEFLITPNDGFAVLLPNEEMTFFVSFAPQSAIDYNLDLTVLTSCNDKYIVNVHAKGAEPPITLSTSVMHLRTTAPGHKVTESFLITNHLHTAQQLELMPPDKTWTWLSLSPLALNLAAGETARVEIEFTPPRNLLDLDPRQWKEDTTANVSGKEAEFFEEWQEDHSWVTGRNHFGEIQWTLPLSLHVEIGETEAKTEVQNGDDKQHQVDNDDNNEEEESDFMKAPRSPQPDDPLPSQEWGIIGIWNIPIFIKSRGNKKHSHDATNSTSTLPLFVSIETAVTRPQISADVTELDFGQLAVSTRQLKSFRVFNHSSTAIKVKAVGINAVGPFTVLRPTRLIAPQESRVIIIECLPPSPGLTVEVLEILAEDEDITGGHRLYIPLRVQGLMPSITLEGLLPPPMSWNPRAGLLDFGHVLVANDIGVNVPMSKKFLVRNKSLFAIDVRVIRVVSDSLPPSTQLNMVERTATGQPIISIRPEKLTIAQGGSEEVEVIFRPDRSRFLPYREDLDLRVGLTEEVLRVGVIGRAWNRQYQVIVDSSKDEALGNIWLTETAGQVEDLAQVVNTLDVNVRNAAIESKKALNMRSTLPLPPITLQFPDPFAPDAEPDSYTEIDPSAPPAGGKGGKAPAAAAGSVITRRQVKKLRLVNAKSAIASQADAKPASFEIILDPGAKESGFWSFSVEKGALTAAKDEVLEVICTLPKARQLGGVAVGSWKTFDATVVIKGGWFPAGEGDENRIPIRLQAFVSI